MSAGGAATEVRLVDVGADVRLLSWRRDGRHNALDLETIAALGEHLAELRRQPPGALVLWGEGGDFSAGADLEDVREVAMRTREDALAYSQKVQALAEAVEAVPAPVVAAIEGVCLGLGLEIALAAGVRVAASDARLGLPEMTHGLFPAAGGTARLPEAVGEGRARALILEGMVLGAEEAQAIALVERLALPGRAREAAIAWAAAAAGVGEAATRFLAVRRSARGEAFERALRAEREGFADLVRSAPVRRRLDAFLARRRKPAAATGHDERAAPARRAGPEALSGPEEGGPWP